MTHNGGFYGVVSPDGQWLYYSVTRNGIWRMPAEGGEARQVLPAEAVMATSSFTVTRRGVYTVGARPPGQDRYTIVFHPFDQGEARTLLTPNRPPAMFLAVSPDERWLLYTLADDPTMKSCW